MAEESQKVARTNLTTLPSAQHPGMYKGQPISTRDWSRVLATLQFPQSGDVPVPTHFTMRPENKSEKTEWPGTSVPPPENWPTLLPYRRALLGILQVKRMLFNWKRYLLSKYESLWTEYFYSLCFAK